MSLLSEPELLLARARELARRDEPVDPGASIEVLGFTLAAERYALETRHVVEVQPLRNLTPLPGTPAFVRGIVNLRGRVLPVYDLMSFFGLSRHGLADLHRIVVVASDDLEIGILADSVTGVHRLPTSALSPPLPTLTEIGAHHLLGITAEREVVLDLARVLADPRIIVDHGDTE